MIFARGKVFPAGAEPGDNRAAVVCGVVQVVAALNRDAAVDQVLKRREGAYAASVVHLDHGRWVVYALPLSNLRRVREEMPAATLIPAEASVAYSARNVPGLLLPAVLVDKLGRDQYFYVLINDFGQPIFSQVVPATPGDVLRIIPTCEAQARTSPKAMVFSFSPDEEILLGEGVATAVVGSGKPFWEMGLPLAPGEAEILLPEEAAARERQIRQIRAKRNVLLIGTVATILACVWGGVAWLESSRVNETAMVREQTRRTTEAVAQRQAATLWDRLRRRQGSFAPVALKLLRGLPPSWAALSIRILDDKMFLVLGPEKGGGIAPSEFRALDAAVRTCGAPAAIRPVDDGYLVTVGLSPEGPK